MTNSKYNELFICQNDLISQRMNLKYVKTIDWLFTIQYKKLVIDPLQQKSFLQGCARVLATEVALFSIHSDEGAWRENSNKGSPREILIGTKHCRIVLHSRGKRSTFKVAHYKNKTFDCNVIPETSLRSLLTSMDGVS